MTATTKSEARTQNLILTYHSVLQAERADNDKWSIQLRNFLDQIDFLRSHGWTSLSLDEYVNSRSTPQKAVVITFDDGYANNIPAFDAILERNLKATCFVVADALGKRAPWLKNSHAKHVIMDVNQLRHYHDLGIEIGSHSCSHADLTTLSDADLGDEIHRSKIVLDDLLGESISSFAYPYGRYDARVLEQLESSDYKAACSTRSGWTTRSEDCFQLRRLSIYSTDNLSRFRRKLMFADNEGSILSLARYYGNRLITRFGYNS